jgi:hypothetical protein
VNKKVAVVWFVGFDGCDVKTGGAAPGCATAKVESEVDCPQMTPVAELTDEVTSSHVCVVWLSSRSLALWEREPVVKQTVALPLNWADETIL